MSSLNNKKININNVGLTKLPVVATVQEKVGLFVAQVLKDKGLDYRDVSERAGGQISHTAVWDIVNGRVKDIKIGTLQSLARGLGVPVRDLIDAAFDAKPQAGELQSRLLHCFDELPEDRQRDALAMVEMLYQRHGSQIDATEQSPEVERAPSRITSSTPPKTLRRERNNDLINNAFGSHGKKASKKDQEAMRKSLEDDDETPNK